MIPKEGLRAFCFSFLIFSKFNIVKNISEIIKYYKKKN